MVVAVDVAVDVAVHCLFSHNPGILQLRMRGEPGRERLRMLAVDTTPYIHHAYPTSGPLFFSLPSPNPNCRKIKSNVPLSPLPFPAFLFHQLHSPSKHGRTGGNKSSPQQSRYNTRGLRSPRRLPLRFYSAISSRLLRPRSILAFLQLFLPRRVPNRPTDRLGIIYNMQVYH